MDGKYVKGSYYFYAPSKGAAIFFAVAFLLSCVTHIWQATRYRSWLLTPLYPFCCFLFTTGFILREYGAFHFDNLNVFIASVCITYAAPPLLELQNYHILGRILYYVPYHSPLHPGRVLTTFGFVSSIVEALNGWGASYSANQSLSDSEIMAGHALIKTSLTLQLGVIVCFVWMASAFHWRCHRAGAMNSNLKSSLITLYTSTCLILARTIYRTVEYFGLAEYRFRDSDFDPQSLSALVRYEVFFYLFEASIMLVNCYLFNFRHPRRYLPRSNKVYLARDGVTEVDGPGFRDSRPLWQTLVDPFDIMSLVKGNISQTNRFWDDDHSNKTGSTGTRPPQAHTNIQRSAEQ